MTDTRPDPTPRAVEERFDGVLLAELERIARIRRNKAERRQSGHGAAVSADGEDRERPDLDRPLAGLALSGGGIRSAAFNLGVLHALANRGALERFDYLSTVSGGGYIGSSLTWFLSKVWVRPDGSRYGTGRDDHPLGRRGAGAKTSTANDRIDHIRGFGNYLRPTPELWTGSAAALVLQSMAYVVMLWFFPLSFLLLVLDRSVWLVESAFARGWALDPGLGTHLAWLWVPAVLVGLLALTPVTWLPQRLASRFGAGTVGKDYLARLARQHTLGILLAAGLGLALLSALPRFHEVVETAGATLTVGGLVSTLSTVTGLVASRPRLREVALRAGVLLLAVGLLVLAATLPETLAGLLATYLDHDLATARAVVALLASAAAVAAIFASLRARLNHIGLHRLYRDRLMETFLPDCPSGADCGNANDPGLGTWRPAVRADATPLADMCDETSLGPYHLIGTNVILVGSTESVARNRGGESFLLSPLYAGCDRTGWRPTDTLFGRVQLQLATAMAVSGAAVSPNTGASGRGLTRGTVVARLMMLFNVRLAYWVPNPNPAMRRNERLMGLIRWADGLFGEKDQEHRPRFAYPGFAALLGITHAEDSGYVELSDGGHFENLGLYELVRRRVPLIVVADAGQDPALAFADLANAIERVRVDFGVEISFHPEGLGLDGVQCVEARKLCVGGKEVPCAVRGWAVARIRYPAAPAGAPTRTVPTRGVAERAAVPVELDAVEEGALVYLKPTLHAGLPADVLAYRASYPEFPHETTADQFFDELQFEAYRELGYATAGDFLRWLSHPPQDAPPLGPYLPDLLPPAPPAED